MKYETPWYAKGASTALSATAAVIPLTMVSEERSAQVPQSGRLGKLLVVLTDIDLVTPATSVTWYLAADADGDVPITPEVTTDITAGETAGKGGVVALIDCGYAIPATLYVEGTVYLVIATDADTPTAVPYLEFYS